MTRLKSFWLRSVSKVSSDQWFSVRPCFFLYSLFSVISVCHSMLIRSLFRWDSLRRSFAKLLQNLTSKVWMNLCTASWSSRWWKSSSVSAWIYFLGFLRAMIIPSGSLPRIYFRSSSSWPRVVNFPKKYKWLRLSISQIEMSIITANVSRKMLL